MLLTPENFQAAPGLGGLASYDVDKSGTLTRTSPTVGDGQTDSCWVGNTENGKYACVTSAFRGLVPVGSTRRSAETVAISTRNVFQSTITGFRIENDGSLTKLQDVADPANLPAGSAIGIAGR